MREWPELAEAREKIAEADVDIDRLDIGARHHDVVDAHLAETKDVGEHRPLFRREAGGDILGGERVGKIFADRAGALEADGGAQPSIQRLFGRAPRLAAGRPAVRCCLACRCRSSGPTAVGIGDAEAGEYSGFELLHHRRLAVVLVVVAEKMEETVDDEMGEMVVEGDVFRLRPRGRCLQRRGRCRRAAGRTLPLSPAAPGTKARWSRCPCRDSDGSGVARARRR